MNKRLLIVVLLFIFSGLASLVYQVVWFKQLSYFLGNTTYSQSVVLATFMGGLALGAWYWGKKADKFSNNLRLFAYLEIALALYCFFYNPIFNFTENQFIGLVKTLDLPSDSSLVLLLKLIVSSLTMLLPTFLMGGTLPVLVRFLNNQSSLVGTNVAVLYFVNSLGAVLGTVLAGFFLLQYFGLKGSIYIGATLELAVGVLALSVSRTFSSAEPRSERINAKVKRDKEVESSQELISEKQFKIILWMAALTGLCSMIYEVAWLRILIPILSSSTYSFTIILTVFITGITLGSYLVYKYQNKIKRAMRFVAYCQIGIVLSILLSLPLYERVPFTIWSVVSNSDFIQTSYNSYLVLQFILIFFLMIIPTIFMGMTLPILSRIAIRRISDSGQTIGRIFALNTLGTVVGSIGAGLVLIPTIGIRNTITLALLINILIAYFAISNGAMLTKNTKRILTISTALASVVYLTTVNQENWAHAIMISDIPRKINRDDPPESYKEFFDYSQNANKIKFYKEGVGGTIVVGQYGEEFFLVTNGKGDANSVSDLRTQVSLGLTPVTLHPSPDSIFVIGFGAGTTIGHAASHPAVKYADVAEISAEVVEASSFFEIINNKPLSNSKVNVIRDDGVSALRLSNKKYDIIISQPSNPWSAGVGNLFTDEFFRDCKEHLRPSGMVAQWFSLYEMDDKSLRLILRTALQQFQHVSLWHIGKSDILLICTEHEQNFDLAQIQSSFDKVRGGFEKIDIYSVSAFLSQQLTADMTTIKQYAGKGKINTENHPYLELWAPKAYYLNTRPTQFEVLDDRKNILKSNLLLNAYLKLNPTMDDILQAGLFQSTGGSKELAFYLADLNPQIYLAWAQRVSLAGDEVQAQEYRDLFIKASEKRPLATVEEDNVKPQSVFNQNPHQAIATMHAEQGQFDLALKEIEKALKIDPNNSDLHYQKGTFHLSLNQLPAARSSLEKSIQLNNKFVEAYINLATVVGMMGDYKAVVDVMNQAEKIDRTNPKIFYNRGYARGFLNEFDSAYKDFTRCIELQPTHGQAFLFRGHALLSMNRRSEACADFRKALSMNVKGAAESLNQSCN
jgi:spermidine synthase